MGLESGGTLLHYRLTDKLGEGGMGVVWQATDTTLDRPVAIKVLPDSFAAEPERLARFEREARVLASLNHPNIAGIHGIHEAEGRRFLSMELVPGEDLASLLERGPLPLERTLDIAKQIATAVEAAHEFGVVHRDLKPANVRVTPDGVVKVLDFGLAKAHDPATASDPMRSATVTSAGTVAGLILGTAAYMSPEQAAGQPTDRRCDIWSFGVMLHEMLTGKRMFEGETISHTLADVLRKPVELDDLPESTPASLRRLLERCLDRDRNRRLRDIGEARVVLEDVLAGDDAPTTEVSAGPRVGRSRLPWFVAGAAVLLAIVAFVVPSGPAVVDAPERFSLEMPNSGFTRQGDGLALAISSDGRTIVTRGGAGNEDQFYRRSLGSFEFEPIPGTINSGVPTFSPDDQWIAFMNTRDLMKIRVSGGPPTRLGDAPASPGGLDWGDDGYLYYDERGELLRVPEDGGDLELLTENIDARLEAPHLLPGGRVLLCYVRTGPRSGGQIHAFDLLTREATDLGMPGTHPRYLPSGHVMFAQGDGVFVASFDLDARRFTGSPHPVLERAWVDQGTIQAAVADNGTVVYLPGAAGEKQSLVRVDLDGKSEPLVPDGVPFVSINDPRISRDGSRLLISVEGGAIWMIDLETRTPTLMSEGSSFYPLWSPDGDTIVFSSTLGKSFDIYRRPVDLRSTPELLVDLENNARTGDWTWQGELVVREEIPNKGMDLRLLPDLDDVESMRPLMEGQDDELAPVVSRDGRWMAYVSDYSGVDEVYITTFPETGARLQVSTRGGTSPTWSPDGETVYFLEGIKMMAVRLEKTPRLRVLSREELFEGNYTQYRWSRQYDIHPDGSHFIMIRNPLLGTVEMITGWFQELDASEP